MTNWCVIEDFPRYEVSDTGVVRNTRTQRHLKVKVNQYGVVGVGLMRHGIQFHRSVPLLVAQAFLKRSLPTFDTPINLDGDRYNNEVSNLMWRPRWFAIAYNRQFKEAFSDAIDAPIVDLSDVKVVFTNSFVCATHFGLLEKDLVLSILNRTYVWPTYQVFGVVGETFR
jgi:hypothetical protein